MNDVPASSPNPRSPRFRLPRIGGRFLFIALEIFVILLVLAGVGGGVLLWRLNQGPMEIDFARKYIESELSDPARSITLQVDKIYFDWSFSDSRPRITLQGVRLNNSSTGQVVLGFEAAKITLSRRALLIGQVAPRSIEISRPLLTLVRQEDGKIRLALEQAETPDVAVRRDLATQSDQIMHVLEMMSRPPRDLPHDWPGRSLHRLAITDARMMVIDHVLQQSWLVPKLVVGFTRADRALSVDAALWFEDTARPHPGLRLRAEYQGQGKTIGGMLDIRQLRADFLAEKFPDFIWLENQDVILDGQGRILLSGDLSLLDFQASLQSQNGNLIIPDLYRRAIGYRALDLDVRYDVQSDLWSLERGEFDFNDSFRFSLAAHGERLPGAGYKIPATLTIHELHQDQVSSYWPDTIDIGTAREWAEERLSKGRIHDSTIDLTLLLNRSQAVGGGGWSVVLESLKAAFQIADMDVDYSDPLLPVRKASATGTYDYQTDRMEITVSEGMIGDMEIETGKITIDTVVGDGIGTASIDAKMKGPLKTVFEYIALDPILVDDVVSDIQKVRGMAELSLNVTLPTLADVPADQVIVTGTGTARDVFLPGAVAGLDVSGGPATITVKDGRVDVTGTGQLSGRAMDFTFTQYFDSEGKEFSARAEASLGVDQGLRDHFGIDLSDWLDGTAPAKITYTLYRGGRAVVDADVDATPLTLMVKPMRYTKAPGRPARASARAVLQDDQVSKIENLFIETPDGRTEGASLTFTQRGTETALSSGSFPRVRLYETDLALDFTLSAQNVLSLDARGSFLDARPFLEKGDAPSEPYTGPAISARVTVPRMRTAEARVIEDVVMILSMDAGGTLRQLEMDSRAGQGALIFRLKPDTDGQVMTLHIEAEDAGAALKSFDIYENVVGGILIVTGRSAPGADSRIVSGTGQMRDFKVVNAPALARLLNAISLPGLLQLLASDGISFTRLESEFTWSRIDGADSITMKDGRTSGSSIGLTFEGTVDRAADRIDISGTIVPVTLVNDILGNIPLIGQILSGGSRGGVFAATYTIRGDAKNPTITVNPLAVLAPGFLRRIFFE